jgi:radical SAM/Cys-rich protein
MEPTPITVSVNGNQAELPTNVLPQTFAQALGSHGLSLSRGALTTVQVNLGKLCNQTCSHCHVDAGPHRIRENMDEATVHRVLTLIRETPSLKTLDLTGGAPELNPHFRDLVSEARHLGLEVIDRCNLTVLFEPQQKDLAEFLAANQVRIVASLPCYSKDNVDTQRGDGVFEKSIAGLRLLNDLGYGKNGYLVLDLVYNPGGAFLPPPQEELEVHYRQRLVEDWGISFSNLFALTNLPVKRFAAYLKQQGQLESYLDLLRQSFNPTSVPGVMCRSLVSVSWDGRLFDCDFNQMQSIPLAAEVGSKKKSIWEIDSFEVLSSPPGVEGHKIAVGTHCFGCTAGQGSSCQGAVV